MSDTGQNPLTSTLSYSKNGKDVGDSYDYPNIDTYNGPLGRRVLKKGAIFALGRKTVTVTPPPRSLYANPSAPVIAPYSTTVSTQYFKRFQYNPPTLQLATQFVPLDPAGTQQAGGAAQNISGLGAMSTSIELLFTRETETFRATNGNLGGGRMNAQSAAVYARIGVQKDIYDIYRVIMANGDDLPNGSADVALPDDMSLAALTGKAFDLATQGSQLYNRPVGLILSDDMVVYGLVSALNIVYDKFNKNLVPVMARVNISLEVTSVRPSTSASSTTVTATTTASGGSSSALPDPGVRASATPDAGTSGPVVVGSEGTSGA